MVFDLCSSDYLQIWKYWGLLWLNQLSLYITTTTAKQVHFIEGYKGSGQSNSSNLSAWRVGPKPVILNKSARLLLLEVTPQVLSQFSS